MTVRLQPGTHLITDDGWCGTFKRYTDDGAVVMTLDDTGRELTVYADRVRVLTFGAARGRR